MTPSEQISCIALSIMFRTRGRQLLELYRHAGSAAAIVSHADNLQAIVPDLNPQAFLIDETALSEALRRAEGEAEFAQKHDISILTPTDAAYPARLLNVCPDTSLTVDYIVGMSRAKFKVSTRLGDEAYADFILQFASGTTADGKPRPKPGAGQIVTTIKQYLSNIAKA